MAIVRLIEEARWITLRDGVELVAAGYFPRSFISIAKRLGLDAVVLHYSMLDEYLGEEWLAAPDRTNLQSIKERTRMLVREREQRMLMRGGVA